MKRQISIFVAIIFLLTIVNPSMTVSALPITATATATNVSISGNAVVDNTLTCNYTYFDSNGLAQVGNATYQWYRGSSEWKYWQDYY